MPSPIIDCRSFLPSRDHHRLWRRAAKLSVMFWSRRVKRKPRSQAQRIERTTPPSARKAAPFVADESGLATNATSAARSEERRVGKECRWRWERSDEER